ncbi:MAG: hypothetical protein COB66_03275 [Coxiella sp. (in: Bacteria)]|nr:MAG: hypothetical protein COB66_03275 [Coxiella sp. (in: g-proteobacteria)]
MSDKCEEMKEFLQGMYDTIFLNGHGDRMIEFYHNELTGHYHGDDFDFTDALHRARFMRKHFPKSKVTIDDLVVVKGMVYALVHCVSFFEASSDVSYSVYSCIYDIVDGRIKEYWILSASHTDLPYREGEDISKFLGAETINTATRRRFFNILDDYQLLHKLKLDLSELERDVLYYFLHGYTAKEIGPLINFSYRTVEGYIGAIKDKFACTRRWELRRKLFPLS